MSAPITDVEVSGFRGALHDFRLSLDANKPVTMLFGENGSGKSTILDAIDVVCNGKNGCLDDISVGHNPAQYLKSLGTPPHPLRVTVHTAGDSWTATMTGNTVTTTGDSPRPRVNVLRRSAILKLVLAQPNERYRELQRFVDITVVEQSELALQRQIGALVEEIRLQTERENRSLKDLNRLYGQTGSVEHTGASISWAQGILKTGIPGLETRRDRLQELDEAVAHAISANSKHLERARDSREMDEQLAKAELAISAVPDISSTTVVLLLESIEKAMAYIEADSELSTCPTCQRPIEREQLLSIVRRETGRLSGLKTLVDRRNDMKQKCSAAREKVRETQADLIDALRKISELAAKDPVEEITSLHIAWPNWTDAALSMGCLSEICIRLGAVKTPLERRRRGTEAEVGLFESVQRLCTELDTARSKRTEFENLHCRLSAAYSVVHKAKVAFTQSILDGISGEANRLFQQIHPCEDIGLARLSMEESRRASVQQIGAFHGHQDILPQAIFSESHLDTLGFCVWLALAKQEAPKDTILLIDDVFTSIDSPHLERVRQLLITEAHHFLQLIITTHYRRWWENCGTTVDIQRIQLGRWCWPTGMVTAVKVQSDMQKLRQMIDAPVLDRRSVAVEAGVLLESVLDELAALYRCKLPRNKRNEYTLAELVAGCAPLFDKYNLTVQIDSNWDTVGQPEDWHPTEAAAPFARIRDNMVIRNQVGAHYSELGMDIAENEVRDFGNATFDLVSALTCPSCGRLATTLAADGSHLRCTCPKKPIRMTPERTRIGGGG